MANSLSLKNTVETTTSSTVFNCYFKLDTSNTSNPKSIHLS